MIKEFILPELGENIASADVLKVLVKVGDVIKEDDGVLEIETDKATIEVPSTVAGKVVEVLIKDGDKAAVGQVVLRVESDSVAANAAVTSAPGKQTDEKTKTAEAAVPIAIVEEIKPAGATAIVEFILPELGENITAADVLKVLIKPGDIVEVNQSILEIETDKATIEVPSTIAGKVTEVFIKEGEKAAVGSVIFKAESVSAAPKTAVVQQEVAKVPAVAAETQSAFVPKENTEKFVSKEVERTLAIDGQPPIKTNSAPAAPSVRRIARELGIDINKVQGSGSDGRISMDDVKAYVKALNEGRIQTAAPVASGSGTGVSAEPLPDFSKFGEFERKPMSNIRAKTAVHLSYAWSVIPHVTQFDKVDITDLEKIRKSFAPSVEKAGGKLTVTAILIKVIAAALKKFPQFNSSVDMVTKEVVYKKYYNIGVAVDTDRGLIVPVVRDVDKKNIIQISKDMNDVAEKARTRKISLEELQGACFTITNLGGIGGTFFTPIVNSPEVAILGVSRGGFEPIYKNGNFEPRLMLPLSLSYDHRIIDGADAVRFLRWIAESLEQPLKLLIEG
jgi:pyruvate dehydrogenase E2 component (dihydrolipoamide acetyltransferase)